MRLPHWLTTDEMALSVLGNFKWHHREVAFPPLPLLSDHEDLCSSFDLAVAEEYAQDYGLPETPQVVFLAMLLNDAVKLGIPRMDNWHNGVGPQRVAVEHLPGMVGCNRSRILDVRHQEAYSDQDEEKSSGSKGASSLPTTSKVAIEYFGAMLHGRSGTMATFYAMVVNDAVKLSAVSRDMAKALSYGDQLPFLSSPWPFMGAGGVAPIAGVTFEVLATGLGVIFLSSRSLQTRGSRPTGYTAGPRAPFGGLEMFEAVSSMRVPRGVNRRLREISCPSRPLPENYHGLCPYFDLDMDEESARDFRILKMTQAVFYVMVLNDAVELGVTSGVMADAMMLVLKCLNWDIFES
ncbi:hypothetical protein Cgig2_020643 [Carnegiea gigantea]|uniref:Uncharacterized protein n=1 Tax=Carnegiea gigantea TaxID=171969 RepID=A0A9Q1Q9Q7_9CARY|nr:hypothetical protein Cgig2_020643 [Carnegiea gigantea]